MRLSQRTSATSRQSSIQDNSNDNGESEMSSEVGGNLSKSEDFRVTDSWTWDWELELAVRTNILVRST